MPPPNGPRLALAFDEASGTAAADGSGFANGATMVNGPSRVAGRVGPNAVVLDGTDDYGVVPASPSLNVPLSALTVSAWAYRTTATSAGQWQWLVSRQLGSSWDDQWGLGFNGSSYAFLLNTANSGNQQVVVGGAGANVWVHLAGTYDGTTARLYVNGVLAGSRAMTGAVRVGTTPVVIGGNQNTAAASGQPQELFAGRVDELRVYDRALSPSELAVLAGAAPTTTVPTTTAPATTAPTTTTIAPGTGKRCTISFHGAGGGAQTSWTGADGVTHLFPGGNGPGPWGGQAWFYYPEANYQALRTTVTQTLASAGCQRVIVYGFSNGAAFAAKLLCRGETFGISVRGYVIDDPVVDHAVEGCAPTANTPRVLYWTGGIDIPPGWDCIPSNWICEGGSSIGIDAYEVWLGVTRTPSIYTSHLQYVDPPELRGTSPWW